MNIQNMLSNLGPLIGNGYRSQLNNDPSIIQGRYFLQAESKYKSGLKKDLRLIESTDSPTLGSMEIREAFNEGQTMGQETNEQLMREFNNDVKIYNDMIQLYVQANGPLPPNITKEQAKEIQNQVMTSLKSISDRMTTIANKMGDNVKSGASKEYVSQENINKQIDEIRRSIMMIYQDKDNYNQRIDTVSPVAEAETTGLLSKQRYYYYILWIVLAIIVIYVTVVSMGEGGDSKSTMTIALIIVIIFIVLVGWGYLKTINVPNVSLYEYEIKNFLQFNPLVRIKYTS